MEGAIWQTGKFACLPLADAQVGRGLRICTYLLLCCRLSLLEGTGKSGVIWLFGWEWCWEGMTEGR